MTRSSPLTELRRPTRSAPSSSEQKRSRPFRLARPVRVGLRSLPTPPCEPGAGTRGWVYARNQRLLWLGLPAPEEAREAEGQAARGERLRLDPEFRCPAESGLAGLRHWTVDRYY